MSWLATDRVMEETLPSNLRINAKTLFTLNPKPQNPKPQNPKTLNPKILNPKPPEGPQLR